MIAKEALFFTAKALLKKLISIPSFSKEESGTAECIATFFTENGVKPNRIQNNIWVQNKHFNNIKPTLLLNSHHDTVKPNSGYTNPPFSPLEIDEKLYGLGSNDAGGCLVSLAVTFLYFYEADNLPINLVFAATAEEEISGKNGIELLLPYLPKIDMGVVGEPTLLQMAIAEKGLLVVDATVQGVAGHAARDEGENAIYKALKDVQWLQGNPFTKVSTLLGSTKATVTIINAGTQHNVVPATCNYTIDIRVNELYSFQEIISLLETNLVASVAPRSLRLKSSIIPLQHPLVLAGQKLGLSYYGSPTLSDKALMPFPTLKIGPGDSARSHTADEFIYLHEINEGINTYIFLVDALIQNFIENGLVTLSLITK